MPLSAMDRPTGMARRSPTQSEASRDAAAARSAAPAPAPAHLARLQETLAGSAHVRQLRSLASRLGGGNAVVQCVKIKRLYGSDTIELDDYSLGGLQELRAQYDAASSYQNPLTKELRRIDAAIRDKERQVAKPQSSSSISSQASSSQSSSSQSSSSQSVVTRALRWIGKKASSVKKAAKYGPSSASSSMGTPLKGNDKAHEQTGKSLATSAAVTIVTKGVDLLTGGLLGHATTAMEVASGVDKAKDLHALAEKAKTQYAQSNSSSDATSDPELIAALETASSLIGKLGLAASFPFGAKLAGLVYDQELEAAKAVIAAAAEKQRPLALAAQKILGMGAESFEASYSSTSSTESLDS